MSQLRNRLATETSPYLQQHANNPVHWQPWDAQTLELARQLNKPILLSIGYSACHWCHVMAHESFENEQIAAIMNRLFVNIKVDREERPDLDKIYQSAHNLLNQRGGGWPLTVILTPDEHIPFFAGTYFPDKPKHNMPAFTEVLERIEEFYRQHPEDIDKQNQSLLGALGSITNIPVDETQRLTSFPIDGARQQLEKTYDKKYAGFGSAPKFPHPTNLEFLLRHYSATRQSGQADDMSYQMLNNTLTAMANGGIYDQLGGGFCRYSVDNEWAIPHFEKMLYDNGPLLSLYAQASVLLKDNDAVFKRVATETGEWVIREMTSHEGAYYSTLDADSEGEEGTFYVWTTQQIKEVLTDTEYTIAEQRYGLTGKVNFEGKWHLNIKASVDAIAADLNQSPQVVQQSLDSITTKLFAKRAERIHPGRDEKILTSWNALMIKGMAISGRLLDNENFISSAHNAIDFIRSTLFINNRLLATYKDGRAHLMAYLDDYVFLIDALLESLQTRWRIQDLEFAIQLADIVVQHFHDEENGGFYFTADDHENLIQRPKPLMDEAIPAGNGIAAYALNRLGHLIGEQRYIDAAENTLYYAWRSITEVPYAHGALLFALDEYLSPSSFLIIRGEEQALNKWQQVCTQHYRLNQLTFAIPDSATQLPGLLNERLPSDKPIAYFCSGMSCQAPVTDIDELKKIIT